MPPSRQIPDSVQTRSLRIPYNIRAIRPGPSTRNAMTSKLIQQARAAQPDGRFPEFPPRDDMNNPIYLYRPGYLTTPAPALRLPGHHPGHQRNAPGLAPRAAGGHPGSGPDDRLRRGRGGRDGPARVLHRGTGPGAGVRAGGRVAEHRASGRGAEAHGLPGLRGPGILALRPLRWGLPPAEPGWGCFDRWSIPAHGHSAKPRGPPVGPQRCAGPEHLLGGRATALVGPGGGTLPGDPLETHNEEAEARIAEREARIAAEAQSAAEREARIAEQEARTAEREARTAAEARVRELEAELERYRQS